MKILIVEDHEASAKALCAMLSQKMVNVECRIVETLEAGLGCAVEFGADITLLDLGLPGSTIDQVIESIPLFPPPVICLTDMDDPGKLIEQACWDNMAHNFFSKKFLRSLVSDYAGDRLVEAITKAHWRQTRPSAKARQLHKQAAIIEQNLHEQPR